MKHINTIFAQLLGVIPRYRFDAVIDRHEGNKGSRKLTCWTQFCVMLFSQLSSRNSLRDIVTSWDSHLNTHYHLGASQIKRSTLAEANSKRPSGMYLELFYYLLGKTRDNGIKHADAVRLIDSTTIDLCKQQFEWATFRSEKAGVKIHTVYDPAAHFPTFFSITSASKHDKKAAEKMPLLNGATYVFDRAYNDYAWFYNLTNRDIKFVGRMKSNAKFEVVETLAPSGEGVLKDQLIRLSSVKGKKECPTNLRCIRFIRKEDGKELTFVTNDLKRTASEVADLYKQRWQIELFFKWIKQNLKIKRFIGTSENAVRIQIIIAMIAYLLLHLTCKLIPTKKSLQQLARLLTTTLMQRRNITDLLVDSLPPPKRKSSNNHRQINLLNV